MGTNYIESVVLVFLYEIQVRYRDENQYKMPTRQVVNPIY